MKKYLLALTAFLLVPTGAMAQSDGYIQGDNGEKSIAYDCWEALGKLTSGEVRMDGFFQNIDGKLVNIEIPSLDEKEASAEKPEGQKPEQSDSEEKKEEAPAEKEQAEQPAKDEESEQPVEEGSEEESGEQPAWDNGNNEQVEETEENQQDEQSFENESQFEQEVIRLTNEERTSHGLQPLEAHSELSDVARVKSADMRDNNYFSHTSPTHGSPFDMISTHGIDYRGAGENIAAGQPTPEQVVNGWMNSEGHRENILNDSFTHIGVGHVEGGSYGHYWTQMFLTQ